MKPLASTLPVEDKKQLFRLAQKGGITKETFAAWYTSVTDKPFLDIYPEDVDALVKAATALAATATVKAGASA